MEALGNCFKGYGCDDGVLNTGKWSHVWILTPFISQWEEKVGKGARQKGVSITHFSYHLWSVPTAWWNLVAWRGHVP